MSEPATGPKAAHAQSRSVSSRQPSVSTSPQPVLMSPATTAGNLAIQHVAAPRLQRKSHAGRRGDLYEEKADRVSQHVLSLISAPTVQRKCACGGEGECDECKRKATAQRADIHRKTDDLAVQRAASGEEAPGTTTPTGPADNSTTNGRAAPVPASSPGLIVEDNLTDLGAGQMKKSEFLGQLRGPVSTATQAGLQGTKWSSLGAVAIEPWFLYYSRQSAQQLERSIQQSVPGSSGITSASAYIPLVSARVQGAVGEWARTGKVPPGVPAGLPGIGLPGAGVLSTVSSLAQSAGDVLSNVGSAIGGAVSDVAQGAKDVASSIGSGISSAAQGVGNALSSIGDALFKAKDGGARNADDPRAIQSQLGAGESLDGSLQSRMSSAFGYDFSSVRVHKDNRAAQLSSDLNARAFTVGSNVAFGANEYQPGTLVGDALIAHELAHVVQQGGATGRAPLQKGESETGALEDDADFSAVRAVASLWSGSASGLANIGRNAVPALKSGLRLQRCKDCGTVPPTPAPFERFNLPGGHKNENLFTAPGEQVLFSALFQSIRPSAFETSYTGVGGHFDFPTGPAEKKIPGTAVEHMPFFVDPKWDGASPVTVHMQIKRLSDGAIVATKDWSFAKKPFFPTTIRQVESEGELSLNPGEIKEYSYIVGPEVGADGRPRSYKGQTILERFEPQTCNISPGELKPEFKTAHPELATPEAISRFFFEDNSFNASFAVDFKFGTADGIIDQNGENDLASSYGRLQAALITMKEVHFDKPQVFECQPGVILGRYIIRRILKPDESMAMKKFKQ